MRTLLTLALASMAVAATSSGAQAHCATYEQTGGMAGTVTECSRAWDESYSIEKLTMSMMGMTQSRNEHVIRKDGEILSWDRATKQGTRTKDPMHARLEERFGDSDMADVGAEMAEAMGYAKTGTSKTIAGEDCDVWANPQLGDICLTEDFIALEQSMSQGPMSFRRTATSVDRSTDGEAANYTVPDDVTLRDPRAMPGGIDLKALGIPGAQ